LAVKRLTPDCVRLGDVPLTQYPFYYTLLALHGIGSQAAQEELHTVARGLLPSLLGRYQVSDRQSRFRRLAIDAALAYR